MRHIAFIVISTLLLAGNVFSAETKADIPSGVASGQESDKCRIELDDALRGCREYLQQGHSLAGKEVNPDQALVMMYRSCSHPLLQDRLTSAEREKIRSLAKQAQEAEQKLTKKDLGDIKMVIAEFYSPCTRTHTMQDKDELPRVAELSKDVSESDKSIIVKRCKEVWNLFRSAFSRGDIDGALKYVSSRSKDDFREYEETEIGSTVLGDITTAEVIEPSSARFAMRSRDKLRPIDDIDPGQSIGDFIPYDGYVVFTKNSDGKWLVDFFD